MVFEVIDQDVPNILGLSICVELNHVKRLDVINTKTSDIVDLHSNVFEGLGCIAGGSYHIKVDSNAQPVVHPPRKVPLTLRPKV